MENRQRDQSERKRVRRGLRLRFLLNPVQRSRDHGIFGAILERQKTERRRRHVREQLLSVDVGASVIPSTGRARAIEQHALADVDSIVRRGSRQILPALLEQEEAQGGRLDPTERGINPRPGLKAVVLTDFLALRELHAADLEQLRGKPARVGHALRMRAERERGQGIERVVHGRSGHIHEPAVLTLPSREHVNVDRLAGASGEREKRPARRLEPAEFSRRVSPAAIGIAMPGKCVTQIHELVLVFSRPWVRRNTRNLRAESKAR